MKSSLFKQMHVYSASLAFYILLAVGPMIILGGSLFTHLFSHNSIVQQLLAQLEVAHIQHTSLTWFALLVAIVTLSSFFMHFYEVVYDLLGRKQPNWKQEVVVRVTGVLLFFALLIGVFFLQYVLGQWSLISVQVARMLSFVAIAFVLYVLVLQKHLFSITLVSLAVGSLFYVAQFMFMLYTHIVDISVYGVLGFITLFCLWVYVGMYLLLLGAVAIQKIQFFFKL